MRGNFPHQAIDNLKTEFFVRLLPALEAQLNPHFHVFFEELDGMIEFSLEIVRIDIRAELKLLHPAAGRFVAFVRFGFLIKEFAIVNNTADGRGGGGRDFDEVELPVTGQFQRGIKGHDAELLFFVVDDSDFAGTNLPVSTMKRFVTLEFSEWLHFKY